MIFAWALAVYGSALAESDEQAAYEALTEAERIAATANNPWLSGLVHHHLAQLATRQDNAERAEDLHQHALAIRHAHGLRPGVAESLEALAGLAVRHRDPTEAVRILAAVDRLRTEIGLARWPADQTIYDEHLQSARTQLDEAGFAAAWGEGQLLSIDEAVGYATRTRGQRRRPTSGWPSLTPTEICCRGAARPGPHQPPDRRAALHLPGHSEDPPDPRLQQTGRQHPIATRR